MNYGLNVFISAAPENCVIAAQNILAVKLGSVAYPVYVVAYLVNLNLDIASVLLGQSVISGLHGKFAHTIKH